jgi:hypothetical protein
MFDLGAALLSHTMGDYPDLTWRALTPPPQG